MEHTFASGKIFVVLRTILYQIVLGTSTQHSTKAEALLNSLVSENAHLWNVENQSVSRALKIHTCKLNFTNYEFKVDRFTINLGPDPVVRDGVGGDGVVLLHWSFLLGPSGEIGGGGGGSPAYLDGVGGVGGMWSLTYPAGGGVGWGRAKEGRGRSPGRGESRCPSRVI